jgi:hypothetical protein
MVELRRRCVTVVSVQTSPDASVAAYVKDARGDRAAVRVLPEEKSCGVEAPTAGGSVRTVAPSGPTTGHARAP